jgi:hypothetical protein
MFYLLISLTVLQFYHYWLFIYVYCTFHEIKYIYIGCFVYRADGNVKTSIEFYLKIPLENDNMGSKTWSFIIKLNLRN